MLGIGLGGFIDGILFHQILQTHAMLTAKRPKDSFVNCEVNMLWDGIFHAVTWTATPIGIAMLFKAARRPEVPWNGRILLGGMLLGWGAFNVVEGTIDHHLLHLHHVVERLGVSVFDWGFLVFGALLILAGSALVKSACLETVSSGHAPMIDHPEERSSS